MSDELLREFVTVVAFGNLLSELKFDAAQLVTEAEIIKFETLTESLEAAKASTGGLESATVKLAKTLLRDSLDRLLKLAE